MWSNDGDGDSDGGTEGVLRSRPGMAGEGLGGWVEAVFGGAGGRTYYFDFDVVEERERGVGTGY